VTKEDEGRHVVQRWLADRARNDGQATAIESTRGTTTYTQLDAESTALAHDLIAAGLSPGERVASVTENCPEHVTLLFACAKARLALAPLNWRLTPHELAVQLSDLEPALLVSSELHRGRAAAAAASVSCRAEHARIEGLTPPRPLDAPRSSSAGHQSLLAGPESFSSRDDDPLLIVFTSGSTGVSKGAVLSQSNCFWTTLSLDAAVPLSRRDVVLQILPQCHVGGWNVQPLQAWSRGATVVLEAGFSAERVLRLLVERGITTMMGVPANYLLLAEHPDFPGTDLSRLRNVIVGGAAMPPALLRIWQERDVAVIQGYGLTEAGPNVLYLDPDDSHACPGSVGVPYPYVDVELRDPVTAGLRTGPATGELWVKGPSVFAGYWRNEAATTASLRDGWLATGDLGERDSDGHYRICGRLKEMYVSGGENVYPAEIEAALVAHPQVVEAAVIGVPDERWGETGVGFVTLRDDAGLTAAEITKDLSCYCRGLLAGFKVPSRFVVLDRFPRLSNGKVDKTGLKGESLSAGTHQVSGRPPGLASPSC